MSIYEQIRNKRKAIGFSQSMLAEKANCSVKTIRNLENGNNIHSSTLLMILNVLNMKITEN